MYRKFAGVLLLGAVAMAGCQENNAPTNESNSPAPELAKSSAPLSGTAVDRAAQIVAKVNARLEASGSTKRLDDAYFFTLGQGTPDYRRLRTGPRWVNPTQVTYSIDESDLVAAPTTAATLNALLAAHEAYNHVSGIVLHSDRVADNGANNDILDGVILGPDPKDPSKQVCVDIVDLTSPVLNNYDPATGNLDFTPVADNLFGGWLTPQYFNDCLGDPNILGVTWTFSDVDGALTGERDGYRDRIYTEQYYNSGYKWVTSGAQFLGDDMDVLSIVLHEVGHTHGLGHFGGPNPNEPFKLQPNGKVFDPEAVMNPFYLGGEKQSLFPTDISGLKALYSNKTLQ
jgi:hypothetical protein